MYMFTRLIAAIVFVILIAGNVSAQTINWQTAPAAKQTDGNFEIWTNWGGYPLVTKDVLPKGTNLDQIDAATLNGIILGGVGFELAHQLVIEGTARSLFGQSVLPSSVERQLVEKVKNGNWQRFRAEDGETFGRPMSFGLHRVNKQYAAFVGSLNPKLKGPRTGIVVRGITLPSGEVIDWYLFDKCLNVCARTQPPVPAAPPQARVEKPLPAVIPPIKITIEPLPADDRPAPQTPPPPVCQDQKATNYGEKLPCTYPPPSGPKLLFNVGLELQVAQIQKRYSKNENHGFKNEKTNSANTLLTAHIYAPKLHVFGDVRGTVPLVARVGTWSFVDRAGQTVKGPYDHINGDGQQQLVVTAGYQRSWFHGAVGYLKHDVVQDFVWSRLDATGKLITVHEVRHLKHEGFVLGGGVQHQLSEHFSFRSTALWAPELSRKSTTAQTYNGGTKNFSDGPATNGKGIQARAMVTAHLFKHLDVSGGYEYHQLGGYRPFRVTPVPVTVQEFHENVRSHAGVVNVSINFGR